MSYRTESARLNLEKLEDRWLPARTYFILDFSPDYRSGGSLYSTFFNVRLNNGNVPSFFDFDRNRVVDQRDVRLAAAAITNQVRYYYRNYLQEGLVVYGGDDLKQTFWGNSWLRAGLRSTAQVDVIYLGGRDASGAHGRAPRAFGGTNVEGCGEVYTRTIAIDLYRANPRATPEEYARNVASSTAHELGHMQGLDHAVSGASNNIMRSGRDRAYNFFENSWVRTEHGLIQNAHHELWYSFAGQRTQFSTVTQMVPDAAPSVTSASPTTGTGCCCSGCSGQTSLEAGQKHEMSSVSVALSVAAAEGKRPAQPASLAAFQFEAERKRSIVATAPVVQNALLTLGTASRKSANIAVTTTADRLFGREDAFSSVSM